MNVCDNFLLKCATYSDKDLAESATQICKSDIVFDKVSANDTKGTFSCQLNGLTLTRKHLKIWLDEPWPDSIACVDIYVVKSKLKKEKLCTLSSDKICFEWSKSKCSRDQLKLLGSSKISLECEVLIRPTQPEPQEMCTPSTPSHNTSVSGDLKKCESPNMRLINETTPHIEADMLRSPLAPKKRTRDENSAVTPSSKSRRQRVAMRALSSNYTTPPSKLKAQSKTSPSVCKAVAEDPLKEVRHSDGKITRCVDLSSRVPKPSNRWGHTMCHTHDGLAVLIGGQGDKSLSKDSVWYLDPEMRTWKCPEIVTEGTKPEYRMGHTATYDPTMRCIYVYGGSKNTKWFHDVHIFDLDVGEWSLVKADGKAPTRAYHSTTLYRHELWVFGGVFPRPDPQPDGCDNEVHIFSPIEKSWYKPIVTGEKPRSRSGHSANLINDLLIVFGGWDFPYCYNDLFVLDMTTVDWSQPKVDGKPPKPRSWHASCVLTDNRVFIHGGYDGDNALHDAHIFDYYSKTWCELVLDNAPSARAGHTSLRLHSNHENLEDDEIIIFGGGDNDGSYFSDMLSFYVPFNPKIVLAE